jgi:nitroreductase
MEFMRVLGSRRSVRYFQEGREVERDKIQAMLTAGQLASRAMNNPASKAVVVYRNGLSKEDRDALKTPWATVEFDLAPVYILWYNDMDARRISLESKAYPSVPSGVLQQMPIFGPLHGWSRKYVEEVILPEVLMPGLSRGPQRGGNSDAAMGMMQAYLCAIDEGLGACLAPFDEEAAARILGVPETFEPVSALLVGYPAEPPEAGGQRPKAPWAETVFLGNVKTAYPRDERVTERLREQGLIQEPAPLPWRADEVRALSRGFRLPGGEVDGEVQP